MGRGPVWEFVLIGGPYDGERGIGWYVQPGQEPPLKIVVGWCEGNGMCPVDDGTMCSAKHLTWARRSASGTGANALEHATRYERLEIDEAAEKVRYLHAAVDLGPGALTRDERVPVGAGAPTGGAAW